MNATLAFALTLLGGLLFATVGPGRTSSEDHANEIIPEELPALRGNTYKVDPYIAAARILQAQDRVQAGNTLLRLGRQAGLNNGPKVIVLARMLFAARSVGQFRRPALGLPNCLAQVHFLEFALEPIEVIDGVPFLLVRGYSVGGYPEQAESYVKYCLQNCDWAPAKYTPKTPAEKRAAAAKLMAYLEFRGGFTDDDRTFLISQVD